MANTETIGAGLIIYTRVPEISVVLITEMEDKAESGKKKGQLSFPMETLEPLESIMAAVDRITTEEVKIDDMDPGLLRKICTIRLPRHGLITMGYKLPYAEILRRGSATREVSPPFWANLRDLQNFHQKGLLRPGAPESLNAFMRLLEADAQRLPFVPRHYNHLGVGPALHASIERQLTAA